MKAQALREKSDKDLRSDLKSQQAELAELVLKQRTSEVKKNHRFKGLRRQIAQIKSVIRERQLIESESGGGDG